MGMPPQTFDVRGNVPVAIAATPLPEPLTVLNMDAANEIYLSAEPVSGGFPLSPGSTMTWDQGQRLYITCVDGANARVGVVYNGGQIIDSRALAVQIVNAGLADEIATKISLAGVPPIDRPKTVADVSGGSLPSSAALTPSPVDVGGYLSLTGRIYIITLGACIMELIVEQNDASGPVSETRYTFANGAVDFEIPLTHNFVTLTLQRINGATPTGYTAYFRGSYRERSEKLTCSASTWEFGADYPPNRVGTSATLTVNPTQRVVYYPSWRTGDVTLTFGFNSEGMAALNTKGIGALLGEGPAPGYATALSRGHIGEAKWTDTILKPRIYTGYVGRDQPKLALYNWNPVAIDLNINLQYRI